MTPKISVVINTLNEEQNIERAIKSVSWADELIVCDMHSEDKTVEIAKKLGAKIFFHKKEDFVELARNFAISKATNEWILILDADEEIPDTLGNKIKEIASQGIVDFVNIPRKNIIFGHFMQYSGWWPDFNIRFFKKDNVKWFNKIHRPPETTGKGFDLPAEEGCAIIHQSYATISQFLKRMDRYTTVQASELKQEGYVFAWKDLFQKASGEFLSRFFANKGYKDGMHGLALSFLQAFSFIVMYLKVWEMEKFKEQKIELSEIDSQKNKINKAIDYWIKQVGDQGNFFKRIFKKVDRRC